MQTQSNGTLADALVPRGNTLAFAVARDSGLIAAGALLVAISAQVNIPWYPVPFTGQTFAVLLVGGLLGAWRGAASLSLYALVGILGLPVFSEQSGGWTYFNGTTGGYIIGFIVAAALVGFLCERGADRNILSLLGVLVLGNAVIFLCGAAWLANVTNPGTGEEFGWGAAYRLGVEPFYLGALVKIGAVAALLPAGWSLVGHLGLDRGRERSED
jgi:biotin transport system substrate-specific component